MSQLPLKTIILRLSLIFIGAALLIGLDQWTKYLAETLLTPGQIVPVLTLGGLGDVCYLVLVRNHGAFLSLGAGSSGIFHSISMIIIPVIALLAILFVLLQPLWNKRAKPVSLTIQITLGLVLAGGSNIIDRVIRGEVTDFLNFGILSLRTGVMNVADLYIMAALIVMVVHTIRKRPAKVDTNTKT